MKFLFGIDSYFTIIRFTTFILCLPWPLTLVASIMSFAGYFPEETPAYQVYGIRFLWFLALIYPAVFFGIIYAAEKWIAPSYYKTSLAVALIPVCIGCCVIISFLKRT